GNSRCASAIDRRPGGTSRNEALRSGGRGSAYFGSGVDTEFDHARRCAPGVPPSKGESNVV
ncbi:MAG: hypothetical protein ACF8TS_03095, partial [Maioricimonas sp. JB049]